MKTGHNIRPDALGGAGDDLLNAVMASCRDAIIGCDLEGVVDVWNQGAASIYGIDAAEAMGTQTSRFVPPERHDELTRLIAAAKNGRATEAFDTVRIKPGGQAFPASVCTFPLRDDSGSVVGFGSVERDISDRVRSADALRAALNEAVEANSAKSRFLANASHELRTPMNAIVGMTALSLEEDLSPELRDYLETVRDSADSMLHLINDVLDLSKFESERFELDEAIFDLRELVDSTIKVLGSAAHAKGLELVCQIDPEVPPAVVGDSIRLRQVITNLVGNAIKFTAAGQVVVGVRPILSERDRCTLEVAVADTGIGISREDQERIFAPFTQVDGATTRKYTGTGLGLTISQHLIECFGGSLEVDSEVGSGSRFSFKITLPVDRKADNAEKDAVAERLGGLKVLVVDDNEASRDALVQQLQAWKMHAEAVADGDAAIVALHNNLGTDKSFDLAVVDALMPGTDGFSVAASIGSDDEILTKPILMASTTDRLEFSRRCAEAGAAGFVQKPVSQSQLLSAVAQATGAASLESDRKAGLFDRPVVQPLQVLLVEDTPANRKVVEKVLARRGHTVSIAVNGREAVDAYRAGKFDIVLMDIQMPIMDGFQATEALREIERNAGVELVPIIAMTAHSMRGDRQRCLWAGMNGYLSKPLDLAELIRTVESNSTPSPSPISPSATLTTGERAKDLVDLDAALARLRGDRDLLLDMMGFYLDDAPELMRGVKAGVRDGDLAKAGRAAHSLKSLAATFDAAETTAAARDVEHACHDSDVTELDSLVQQLDESATHLADWLRDYRSKRK